MDQVAILSDIHANIPAFSATLIDIEKRGIKRIFCLGDIVGKGPNPAEALDLTKEVCEVVVQGNWDLGITYPQDKEEGIWQQQQLGEERLRYLENLPFSVQFQLSGKWFRLFHASAQSVFHRLNRKASKEERHAMFENTEMTGATDSGIQPDVVGYGDIHIPYSMALKPQQKGNPPQDQARMLFNVGSVGSPYDGNPQACYCIVEGVYGSGEPGTWGVQFIRVSYDLKRAVELAEQAKMPNMDRYIREITTGLCIK